MSPFQVGAPARAELPGRHLAATIRELADAIARGDTQAFRRAKSDLGRAGYLFGHAADVRGEARPEP